MTHLLLVKTWCYVDNVLHQFQLSYLLEAGTATLHVAAMHLQNLLRPAANPSAERLNGRPVHAPLSHSKLSQVGSRVAGQSLAVLKEEAAQLAAGILFRGGKKKDYYR